MPDHARDLLKDGESAVVIFTKGSKFQKSDSEGNGHSGNWRIDPNHTFDKVIIYFRPKDRLAGAELFVGQFVEIDKPIKPDTAEILSTRHAVYFKNLTSVGETDVNFHQFKGNKRNDFCFINHPGQ